LGAQLLKPIASRLSKVRRIAVVADETLQILPFAALSVPGSGKPLVETHAVVQLPSASLAAALRARQQARAVPSDIIAVFGDPVFDRSDERVVQSGEAGTPPLEEIARLRESAREAKNILSLVPAAQSRRLLGFAANREAALDPSLERYRYVHFATHGIVDLDNPELSGIQLSRFNPQGGRLEGDGILRFYEVYNLHLPAELVTLSACGTAVGPEVRGEDRLGLSRSFLYAGSSRVIGTLWNVDDHDAADLMTLFYQALLRDGKSPAMALQDAQKKMRTDATKRAPYHWAGFVLQGDWR
jgi:CHAT domain-containing protein